MITQHETKDHYVLVEIDYLNHPFGKREKYYGVRCGDNYHTFINKKDVLPFIEKTYGTIINTIKF